MTARDLPDPSATDSGSPGIDTADANTQLSRVLDSRPFRASRRLSDVLRLICEHSLADNAYPLKERTIAIEAMGRPTTFDSRQDASVRVQMNRLRVALDEYYRADGLGDAVRIHVAKGSYRAIFGPNTAGSTARRVPLTSFVGREDLLEAVDRALVAGRRLVTLTGPGGSGKTRVALEVLARRADLTPAIGVELAPVTDPDNVPMAILTALGLAVTSPGSTSDRTTDVTARLVDVLQTRSSVVLLDNCEHLVDAIAALAEELLQRCPGLTILATSREPLTIPGESQFLVPPLPLPLDDEFDDIVDSDAVRLFVERVNEVDPAFVLDHGTAAAVADICRRLDGIPLALELAAARTRALPVAALAEQLHDPLTVLAGGSRTAVQRQRTLRATIDWSYQLLDEDERALFAACSVFVGGADLDAISSIAPSVGITRRAVAGLVAALVQKSLLVVSEAGPAPRYSMLETIREFASEQLADRRSTVADAHLDWAVQFATTWGPLTRTATQREALDRLDADHENLRTALGRGVATHQASQAAAIVAHLGWFWWARGHVTEGRNWLDAVVALDGEASADLATALAWACQLGFVQHALDDAAGQGKRAVAMHECLDPIDPDQLAEARLLAANPLIRLGRLDEAFVLLQSAEQHLIVTRDPWGLGSVRLVTGLALTASGDLKGAREQFQEALAVYLDGGDGFGAVRTLFRLGDVEESVGELGAALIHCDEGLRIALELGLAESATERTVERGRLLLGLGERDAALVTIAEGLDAARRLALPDTTARGHFALGLADLSSDPASADASLALAADRFEGAALHREAVAALVARIACDQGRDTDENLLARGERCAAAVPGDDRVLAIVEEARAIVLARQGDLDAAGSALTVAKARRQHGGVTTPWWLDPYVDDVRNVAG